MLRIVEMSTNAVKFLVSTIVSFTMWIDSSVAEWCGALMLRNVGRNLKWVGVGQKFALVVCVYKGASQKYPIF